MTARRKPVVAWGVHDGGVVAEVYESKFEAEDFIRQNAPYADDFEIVKLTEADPLARYDAAVVRAAVRWASHAATDKRYDACDSEDLVLAVERREKARRKR